MIYAEIRYSIFYSPRLCKNVCYVVTNDSELQIFTIYVGHCEGKSYNKY